VEFNNFRLAFVIVSSIVTDISQGGQLVRRSRTPLMFVRCNLLEIVETIVSFGCDQSDHSTATILLDFCT